MTTVWTEVLSDDILKHWRQYRLNVIYIQLNRRKHLLNSRAIRHFQPSFAANTRQPPKYPAHTDEVFSYKQASLIRKLNAWRIVRACGQNAGRISCALSRAGRA